MTNAAAVRSDFDPWPTPDQSTVEAAALVFVEQRGPNDDAERRVLLAEVLADPAFTLAISTIWAGRLPTPDSYHRAGTAWEKRLGQVKAVRSVLDRWREDRGRASADSPLARLFDQVEQAVRDQDGKDCNR